MCFSSTVKTNSVYLILLCKLFALISLSKHNLIASSYSYFLYYFLLLLLFLLLSFVKLILSVI